MYKIQNIGAGRIPLQLPEGCITLESGSYLDLDEHATRSWMRTNYDLQVLIIAKVIRVVHDSINDKVPEQPIKPIVRNPIEPVEVPQTPPPKTQATVIDLSAEDDPTEDDFAPKGDVTIDDLAEREEFDPVEQAIMDEIDDD